MSWVLFCAFLVMLMQAGFTCLESGLVRAKNSINVAIKNLVDFCIAGMAFTLLGYGLMFGNSLGGWIGSSDFMLRGIDNPRQLTFFLFELCFCGTATTILSGAVAERMRFTGYGLTAVGISTLIYPIVGHWAWGGVDGNSAGKGWLAASGFIDFAGSTVVHSVGGWVALAALLVIGPRSGRYGEQGQAIEGHSQPLAALGTFLLWFGWFGFNGGSTLAMTDQVPLIVINTAIAGAAGGMAALAMSRLAGRKLTAHVLMTGIIAGLVAITASANLATPPVAIIIGASGGAIGILGIRLLDRWQIDDAIGAVPAHLFAGIWGTLVLALFPPAGGFPTGLGVSDQLLVQAKGVLTSGLYAFGLSYLLLSLLNRVLPLRVSQEEERLGLNIVEHGASSPLLSLIEQMYRQARDGDFSHHVEVDLDTEAGQIGLFYNAVLDRINAETTQRQQAMRGLAQLANYDSLTGLANRRLFFELVERALRRVDRHGRPGAVLYLDLDGFKPINDRLGHAAGDRVLIEIANRLTANLREGDICARLGGGEFAVLIEDIPSRETPRIVAAKLMDAIAAPLSIDDQTIRVGVTIGVAIYRAGSHGHVEQLLHAADQAMYDGKKAGKGLVVVHDQDSEP